MINDVAKTTIRETLDSFYTVLDLLRKGWCDNAETHAVVVKGDLARLTEAEQLEAVALMRALAAKDQKHGTTACEVVGIPLPKVGGLLDRYVIGGVVAELIGELQTANGAEYYSILEMTLELVALLQPMAREHSRDLLIDAGVRAAFIDTELKRRQDGRGPVANEPEADDYQSPTYHTTELGCHIRHICMEDTGSPTWRGYSLLSRLGMLVCMGCPAMGERRNGRTATNGAPDCA